MTAERLTRIAEILAAPAAPGTSAEDGAVVRVEGLLRAGMAHNSLSQIAAHTLDDWTLTRVPRSERHDLEEPRMPHGDHWVTTILAGQVAVTATCLGAALTGG